VQETEEKAKEEEMKPGPPPKPTAVKILEGNPGKRALNKNEPKPVSAGLAEPSAWLPETAQAEWRRVAAVLPAGVVTGVDVGTLEAYCQTYAEWRDAIERMATEQKEHGGKDQSIVVTPNGAVQTNPLLSIARNARRDMNRFAGELGFTPASRTRVKVTDGPEANEGDKAKEAIGF